MTFDEYNMVTVAL